MNFEWILKWILNEFKQMLYYVFLIISYCNASAIIKLKQSDVVQVFEKLHYWNQIFYNI